ncbi:MAG: hypothetical protein O4805_09380, partial [Trichodesmium sp. St16_bin2-tuft]|nr:hypothetical protein [Trichodesmium sp. St16_bin2-tuft]
SLLSLEIWPLIKDKLSSVTFRLERSLNPFFPSLTFSIHPDSVENHQYFHCVELLKIIDKRIFRSILTIFVRI